MSHKQADVAITFYFSFTPEDLGLLEYVDFKTFEKVLDEKICGLLDKPADEINIDYNGF